MRYRALVFGGVVALACWAHEARAEDAPEAAIEARQRYNLGTVAYKEKKYVEAALHFEAAAAQRAHAVTLYTAALAWEQANRPERACDDFGRALEVPGLSPAQAANARDRVATLEKTLGTVAVMAPEGWRVQLEGLTLVQAPARLHGTPGTHKLVVHAPNRPVERRDVSLEAGQTLRVELEESPAEAAPAASPPKPAVEKPASRPAAPEGAPENTGVTLRRSLGFAAIGVGVATLGAGVVLGTQALGAKDAYDAAPTREAFDHAHALQTWTTVAFVAGGVFAAGGVALVLLPEPRSAPRATGWVVRASPGGVALDGAF